MKRLVISLVVLFGLSCGLISLAADFNGDGTNDIGIFRPDSGLWAVRGVTRVYFGGSTDDPMPGDYNGDGTVDIGIYRSTAGLWAVRGITRAYFGGSNDEPLAGISAGGGSGGASLWSQSGSDIYYNSGKVGIVTSSPNSDLHVGGSLALSRTFVYDGTLYTSGEAIIGADGSYPLSFITITLSTADCVNGRVIIINDEGGHFFSGQITINTEGSETIDGSSSIAISTAYGSKRLYSDGSNWFTF